MKNILKSQPPTQSSRPTRTAPPCACPASHLQNEFPSVSSGADHRLALWQNHLKNPHFPSGTDRNRTLIMFTAQRHLTPVAPTAIRRTIAREKNSKKPSLSRRSFSEDGRTRKNQPKPTSFMGRKISSRSAAGCLLPSHPLRQFPSPLEL